MGEKNTILKMQNANLKMQNDSLKCKIIKIISKLSSEE